MVGPRLDQARSLPGYSMGLWEAHDATGENRVSAVVGHPVEVRRCGIDRSRLVIDQTKMFG